MTLSRIHPAIRMGNIKILFSKKSFNYFTMKDKALLFSLFSIIILIFSSCQKDEESDFEKQVKIDDEIISQYLADSSIQAKKHSTGFYYQVITSNNSGKSLVENNVINFYYTVSLLNGTILESTNKRNNTPAQLKLLNSSLIPIGLDYGIDLMKVGEKYRFFIPSYLAFGNYSCSVFEENSIFIVDVKVDSIQSEEDVYEMQFDSIRSFVSKKYPSHEKFASGLYFIDSISGNGSKPHKGDKVNIDFTRTYLNDSLIKSVKGVSFYLGTGYAVQGLEEGIKFMKPGGTAILIMPSGIAFKQSLCIIPEKARKELLDDKVISAEVLPFSIVKYIVKLNSVN
jgi:FKBP-type peptidyl-prolyl cis-trans isomerase